MSKSIYQISKEVSLLIAGALIGVVATLFTDALSEYRFYPVPVSALLILYGIGLFEWILLSLYWLVRKINQKFHFVGIYAPYAIKKNNASWVNVNLNDLYHSLKKQKIRYRIHRSERIFKEYPIIINPYGGVYPEKEFSSLRSLEVIFSYVKNGGIYINIADIPFYYAYDKNLNRRIDTTPLAGDFSLQRSFLATILTKRLNHYVFGLTKGEDFDAGITRIIQLSETSKNLFKKDAFKNGPNGGYSPVLKIPYGRGYFIFSTLQITNDSLEDNIMRVIKAAFDN
ncbi:MAG: hypothetical protein Q8N09_08085 [Thermodesulfovibrionia bacterium]|nr:hypothetical protein [Thermodesulfovibrionia bacterium]